MSASQVTRCAALICRLVSRHRGIKGSPQTSEEGQCKRPGVIPLLRSDGTAHVFCEQHGPLALEGFISPRLEMTSPHAMRDYRKYHHLPHPFPGVWTAPTRM